MYELRILNGLKSGISFPISDEPLSVGGKEANEILMLDKGFTEAELSIVCADSESIEIDFLEGKFVDTKGKKLRGPCAWKVGSYFCHDSNIWFQISKIEDPWTEQLPSIQQKKSVNKPPVNTPAKAKPVSKRYSIKALSVVVGGVAISFAIGSYNSSYATLSGQRADSSPNIEQQVKPSALPLPELEGSGEEVTSTQHLTIIENMLKERELQGVSLKDKGSVVQLEGHLALAEQTVLSRMMIRYEIEYPDGPRLVDLTNSFAETFPVSIVAVVSGPYGHVLLEDGTRLSKGQSYKGYRLSAIRQGVVEFSGKSNVSVNW